MKMNRMIVAAFAVVASGVTFAQGHSGLRQMHGTDITREHALKHSNDIFQRLDLNRNGSLSRPEVQRAHQQLSASKAARHPYGRWHQFADNHLVGQVFANRESVSKAHFRQEMLRQFARMDRNKDNVVSASEQQAKRRNH